MKILVLNCCSSSIKYQLFKIEDESVLARGGVERIGIDGSFLKHTAVQKDISVKVDEVVANHNEGIKMVIETLVHPEYGVINKIEEISAVGHRVVHGGEQFPTSILVNGEDVVDNILDLTRLAPLHNPHNVAGIKVVSELLPGIPQVAVFDTSFHQTMEPVAYIYPLPYNLYTEHGIRRYGFHGTSHKFVASEGAKFLGKPQEDLKIITAHLGNGASITAVKDGKSIDTSMGFTPLEGLVMGTRSGSIDPAIITFLQNNVNLNVMEVEDLLNKESGLLGISGISNDTRDIEKAADEGNERAQLAIEIFCYQVKKHIGAYAAAMGGLDLLVFTAGIGENSGMIREKCVRGLEFLGIEIDPEKNNVKGKVADITGEGGKTKVLVIPTNEELVIARETLELLDN